MPASISLADLAQNQGGLPGEKGDKGDKGDPGEPAPINHAHAITDVSGLQTELNASISY